MSAERYHALLEQACETVELANTYLADGAPRTAAIKLEAASKLLVEAAEVRDALLSGAA